MNKDTEKKLQEIAAQRDLAQKHMEIRPTVISTAVKETRNSAATMGGLVKEFNDSKHAKSAGFELRLDGPKQKQEGVYYLLRFLGGKSGISGMVMLICIPHLSEENFDQARITIQEWSHFSLEVLDYGVGGYAPHERPNRLRSTEYRPVQLGNTYGWVPENKKESDTLGFEQLFNELIHKVFVENLP